MDSVLCSCFFLSLFRGVFCFFANPENQNAEKGKGGRRPNAGVRASEKSEGVTIPKGWRDLCREALGKPRSGVPAGRPEQAMNKRTDYDGNCDRRREDDGVLSRWRRPASSAGRWVSITPRSPSAIRRHVSER